MERQLKDFTITELKAIMYDNIKEMQKLTNTGRLVENELASRAKKAQEETHMDETTNDVVVEEVVEATEETAE